MSSKTIEHMKWHATHQSPDGVLKHLIDGEARQQFNRTQRTFAFEPCSVKLNFCSDGFNPFGPIAKPYFVWPVMLIVYNLLL